MTNKNKTDEEAILRVIKNDFSGDLDRFKSALATIINTPPGRPRTERDQDALFYIMVEIIRLNPKPHLELFLWRAKESLASAFHLKIKQRTPPPLAKKKTIQETILIIINSGELSSATPERFKKTDGSSLYLEPKLEDQLLNLYKKMKTEAKNNAAWMNKTFSELLDESGSIKS